jgi:predicted RNA binding protein YcfA (HicA-like mRNA interferase family)
VLSGKHDASLNFADLTRLLQAFGFTERIRGSHHIYFRSDIEEILNLQPNGSEAKPYQVKQVRNIIVRYQLEIPE